MSLVKWMRKNNRKIMAFVVIMIMLGFVGGFGLQQYLSRLGRGKGAVWGYYLDGREIREADIVRANNELKVLRSLLAGEMLRYRQTLFRTPDFKSRLLGELLFADSQSAAMTSEEMYRAMTQGQLDVSKAEIDAFFKKASGRSELYWILLKAEARRAGCVVSVAQARETLGRFIPQITQGRGSSAMLLQNVIGNYHIPEEQIMRMFADLLGVMLYAEIATNNEAVTTDEIRAVIGRNGEKLTTEFVQFRAADFLEEQPDPNEETMLAQFAAYREYEAGHVTDDNPYGFGYKLPDRVKLEYIILKMEDVDKLVARPTQDEMEKYYADNIERFKEEVQTDPNNPDSKTTRLKKYADVAGEIRRSIIEERKGRLANLIINDALEFADAGLGGLDRTRATSADFKAAAVSYDDVVSRLAEKHKVSAYAGKTGMLSRADLSGDSNLGRLSMEGPNRQPVDLVKMVFAIEQLGVTEMGRFEPEAPRMWENIGPLRSVYGNVMAVVRVVDAAAAEVPADINVSYSTKLSVAGPGEPPKDTDEEVYSVREKVAHDCRLLAAMNTAKARADEFVGLLADRSWTEAIDEYNKLHEQKDESGNVVAGSRLRSRKLSNRIRTTGKELSRNAMRFADNPMAEAFVRNMVDSKRLNDKLYELLGDDKTEATDINAVFGIESNASYYVVKDISRTEVTREDYLASKAIAAFQLNAGRSESLGLTHFNPDNIMRRMNFRWKQPDEDEDQSKKTQEEPA